MIIRALTEYLVFLFSVPGLLHVVFECSIAVGFYTRHSPGYLKLGMGNIDILLYDYCEAKVSRLLSYTENYI